MSEQWRPPAPNPRDAKAQRAADKAYAKAQRPWYKKKRFVIPGAFLGLVILGAALGGGETATTDPVVAGPTPVETIEPPAVVEPTETVEPVPTAAPSAPAPPTEAPAPPPPPAPAADPEAPDALSLAAYQAMSAGDTTLAEVEALGFCERSAETEIAGFVSVVLSCPGEGSLGANAVLQFQNGELISKAQFGLG